MQIYSHGKRKRILPIKIWIFCALSFVIITLCLYEVFFQLEDGLVPAAYRSRRLNRREYRKAALSQQLQIPITGDTERSNPYFQNPAVIVFCYNRPDLLASTLEALSHVEGLKHVTVYVSQDGNDPPTEAVAKEAVLGVLRNSSKYAEFWQHERIPLLGTNQPGHAWLSQHYKWGLDKVFLDRLHSHVIILEDDMILSKDFLTYMSSLAPLLDKDPSLWCISSWNDNGLNHLDWNSTQLFRTSYFPGLGWMMTRRLWDELGPKFPLQAWDHWMRLNSTSKGRECIVPEVNRNKNIGEVGANMQSSVFKKFIARMAWADETVLQWQDLESLRLETYDQIIAERIVMAQIWNKTVTKQALNNIPAGQVFLIPYVAENYVRISRAFRIWPFPRGHHRHLTIIPYKGSTFLLADQRFCPFLPDHFRQLPSEGLTATPGNLSESCNQACSASGLQCKQQDFWFINTCEHLKTQFPCERGCMIELGPDVPNYVLNKSLSTYQTCLVTQTQPQCAASFKDTRRLCPCV